MRSDSQEARKKLGGGGNGPLPVKSLPSVDSASHQAAPVEPPQIQSEVHDAGDFHLHFTCNSKMIDKEQLTLFGFCH